MVPPLVALAGEWHMSACWQAERMASEAAT
jgi:hypothetical protein